MAQNQVVVKLLVLTATTTITTGFCSLLQVSSYSLLTGTTPG